MEKIKTIQLDFLGGKENLTLVRGTYECNGRDYYGLLSKNWEPFADITVNIPDLNCYKCEHIIDWDFINFCFGGSIEKCLERLKKAFDWTYLENRGDYYSFIY